MTEYEEFIYLISRAAPETLAEVKRILMAAVEEEKRENK